MLFRKYKRIIAAILFMIFIVYIFIGYDIDITKLHMFKKDNSFNYLSDYEDETEPIFGENIDIEINENYQLLNYGKNYKVYFKKVKKRNSLKEENDIILAKIELLDNNKKVIFEQEMINSNLYIQSHDNDILEINLLNSHSLYFDTNNFRVSRMWYPVACDNYVSCIFDYFGSKAVFLDIENNPIADIFDSDVLLKDTDLDKLKESNLEKFDIIKDVSVKDKNKLEITFCTNDNKYYTKIINLMNSSEKKEDLKKYIYEINENLDFIRQGSYERINDYSNYNDVIKILGTNGKLLLQKDKNIKTYAFKGKNEEIYLTFHNNVLIGKLRYIN